MGYDRTDCRLCGGAVCPVLDLAPTPIANAFPAEPNAGERYPLGLRQCEVCGHVQIGHVIADAVLYGPDYKYQTPGEQFSALCAQAARLRARYPGAGTVLEIGANNGLNMFALDEAGFRTVIGVDPSAAHTRIWKAPFNVETARAMLAHYGPVDLMVANNVFAHVDDLAGLFDAIDLLLSEDGALVFEVQYLPAMLASGAFDMIYHEHRDYHTLAPLARFLRGRGLAMVDYELLPQHGGSVRVYAERGGVETAPPAEVLRWNQFVVRIEQARKRVYDALNGHGQVVAFGATAKACTLIHHFGIAGRIAHCVDSTPCKQGRYIAGTAIRIYPETLIGDGPILATAWNYADQIRARYPGRELILPFRAHAH